MPVHGRARLAYRGTADRRGAGIAGPARSARDRGVLHLPPPLAARRPADVGQPVPLAPRRPEFRRGAVSPRPAPHLPARQRAGVSGGPTLQRSAKTAVGVPEAPPWPPFGRLYFVRSVYAGVSPDQTIRCNASASCCSSRSSFGPRIATPLQ